LEKILINNRIIVELIIQLININNE
jgi:hypothetical protein